jgi:hypothetical protein
MLCLQRPSHWSAVYIYLLPLKRRWRWLWRLRPLPTVASAQRPLNDRTVFGKEATRNEETPKGKHKHMASYRILLLPPARLYATCTTLPLLHLGFYRCSPERPERGLAAAGPWKKPNVCKILKKKTRVLRTS